MMDCDFQNDLLSCPHCGYVAAIKTARRNCPSWGSVKAGTELHNLLRDWLGVEPTPDCPCRSMAAKMDKLGPGWVESDDGMAEVLGVMKTEHAKRQSDGSTILPWSDFAARQLVLLACRRARAKAAG